MKVRAILESKGRRVVTVRADTSVTQALQRLVLEDIGTLVVSEDGVRVQGMVGEREILRAIAKQGADVLDPATSVGDVMTRAFRSVGPEDDLKKVMGEMTRFRMRHLPVIEDGRLAGLVSIGDAVKSRLEQLELETGVLRDAYIAGR